MSLIKYTAITALILTFLILALIGILSITHDTPVKSVITEGGKDGPPSIDDPQFARSMELFTGTHIDQANKVQILLNGDGTYPQLWKDLASAERTITVQMYYSQPGKVADTLAKYLIDRARSTKFGCCFCSTPSGRSCSSGNGLRTSRKRGSRLSG